MANIRKLRAGRIPDENPSTWVGQLGTIFYDEATGALRISDGVTPGGVNLPFAIASTTEVGGIKAGPGANVSPTGTLTIDTSGLPLGIGNVSIVDTIISTVNANDDLLLESNGTGNVSLVGNVLFHPTNGPTLADPYFVASSDGQITIIVPASDPLAGAVKIVGSTSGRVSPPMNTGVMLQLTGNNDDPSRLYNDSIGAFSAFVGRRINGNLTTPTAIQAGDEIIRISSTGHDGNSVPGAGTARIVYQAKENYTTSARGTNLSVWTTAIGSTTLTKTATFDRENGLTVNGNITTTANTRISAQSFVFNNGGVRTITNSNFCNIAFVSDSIVHLYRPTGDVTVNLNNYTAGAFIRVVISMDVARNVNLGIAAPINSSGGVTTLLSNKLVNNQAVLLEYSCIDGTAGNTFVKASYA